MENIKNKNKRYENTKEYVEEELERYKSYVNKEQIDEFLRCISDLYSDYNYLKLNKEVVYSTIRDKFLEYKSKNIDISIGINKPYYENGDTELMYTFRWARDINIILEWFMLLIEFGGNPYLTNKKNENSFDIALNVFKRKGIDDEFPEFIKKVDRLL